MSFHCIISRYRGAQDKGHSKHKHFCNNDCLLESFVFQNKTFPIFLRFGGNWYVFNWIAFHFTCRLLLFPNIWRLFFIFWFVDGWLFPNDCCVVGLWKRQVSYHRINHPFTYLFLVNYFHLWISKQEKGKLCMYFPIICYTYFV